MLIREYFERDMDEITQLMKNLCTLKGQEFDEEKWRENLQKSMKEDINSEVIVAVDDTSQEIVAMGHFCIKKSKNDIPFGYISDLIVKEENRRLGIGEQIMRYMIDCFKNNHVQSIRLVVDSNVKESARMLFKKLGFQEIARLYELKI